jgi:signal peptidase I
MTTLSAAAGLLVAAVLWQWARRRLLLVTVVGGSMTPTLFPGDRVLAVRGTPRRRGIVVLRAPAGASPSTTQALRVKRLVALAGEPIPVEVRVAHGFAEHATVPPGHVVVIGDHPLSEDSKQWGPIPASCVLATVRRRVSRGPAFQLGAPPARPAAGATTWRTVTRQPVERHVLADTATEALDGPDGSGTS